MTGLTAVVAPAASRATAKAEGRAVSLHVAETLAVVALLGLGGSGKRAAVRLVSGLLACYQCCISIGASTLVQQHKVTRLS